MATRLITLDEGPEISVGKFPVLVGRDSQCDVRIASLRVSRLHCCLAEDQGAIVVRDLGSTNGVRINGRLVDSGLLRTGDELSIAHYRYRMEDGQGPEVTLPSQYGHEEGRVTEVGVDRHEVPPRSQG